MKPFVESPREIKEFEEDQTVVLGPLQDDGERELVGLFTGEFKDGNALLDSLAPDLFAVLKEIVESKEPPPEATWKRAKGLIATIEEA